MTLTTALQIPLVLSFALSASLAVYIWRLRRAPGAAALIGTLIIAALWALINFVDVQTASLTSKIALSRIRLLVLTPLCVTALVMVTEHVWQGARLSWRTIALLCALPLLRWGLLLTENHHRLLRYGFAVETRGPLPVLAFETGPWWPVHFIYADVIFVVCCSLLVRASRDASHLFRRQNLLMLAALALPAASDLLNFLGFSPIPGYNLTPSVLAGSGLLLWWALLRDKALDIRPIALTTVFDNLDDLWLIVDTRDRVVDANRAARQALELAPDVAGQPLEQALASRPDLIAAWREGKGTAEVRVAHRRHDALSLPIRQRDGEQVGRLLELTDVEEREHLQDTLRHAKEAAEAAAEAKSLFMANVAHELRTPLSGVIGLLDLLNDSALGAPERELVSAALRRADDQLALINDLLDMGKLEADRIELESLLIDVEALLKDVSDTFERGFRAKNLAWSWNVDPNVPAWIRGDPTRLKQILTNLVGNAMKFTDKGNVSLTVSCPERDTSRALLRFEVADTGVGVPSAKRDALFQPFTQADVSHARKYGGTGLGLVICRRLCRLMEGDVGFESEEGRGSTFWFTVRVEVSEPPSRPSETDASGEMARTIEHSPRVLLVEDDPTHRHVLTTALQRGGYQVDAASGGAQALDALASAPFDIVLLDVQMPEMSGYEVAQMVRTARDHPNCHIPIIALTASAMPGDREKCLEAGMSEYLGKPVKLRTLRAVMERWLGKSTDPPRNDSDDTLVPFPREAAESGEGTSAAPFDDDLATVLAKLSTDLEITPNDAVGLLREFADALPESVNHLRVQVLERDAVAADVALHRFRGALDSMRLKGFRQRMSRLEASLKHGPRSEAELQLDDIERYAETFTRAVAAWGDAHCDPIVGRPGHA